MPVLGENAAVLASSGVQVTAVDFSPIQVERARLFWADLPGPDFVHAEACTFVDQDLRLRDAVYSTWGAV
ncbi:class I SAM-dependent methyltransferase [Streptomyces bambusae]|uniref:class I SAM-dependent methyltransferase n=1 Tax=Streptomyces bambusae TaxID=1550616 RepID=UPI001CFDC36F|nr:class I SAM-dependent methyltransferase [Streptomyces bambusae]MCB5166978.1 class I SAM-dependent methyltransferase [Streptomyces bambusae]